MARHHSNWIQAFLDYSSYAESPREMRFWAGVSAVAGALRKKVWIDQVYFRWNPNFYIILVAPPGIVSKSTTAELSMSLLREIPGIRFGPDVVTWPALIQALAGSCESFELDGEYIPMSPLTLVASELGNLIQPLDRELINMYIELWDGRKTLSKVTKGQGSDLVEAPWVNMIGCTTPHWIADNLPPAAVGGGFTSRCIFVYADKKAQFVAYPRFNIPEGHAERRLKLIQDLEHIATNLAGEYALTKEAIKWGERWYRDLWTNRPPGLESAQLDGYIARKQTHLHKLAMVLAASERDELLITVEDMDLAQKMLASVEVDMEKVFSRIGKTENAMQVENLLLWIQSRGSVPMDEAYRYMMAHFPDSRELDAVFQGLIKASVIGLEQRGPTMYMNWKVTGKTPPVNTGTLDTTFTEPT